MFVIDQDATGHQTRFGFRETGLEADALQ